MTTMIVLKKYKSKKDSIKLESFLNIFWHLFLFIGTIILVVFMNKIKVMDEILANKIAAGEVIEKCVSIVKELVENSIDAKSSKIECLEKINMYLAFLM